MTRILPIIMLTVGLVLLSSSFAAAATTDAGTQPLAQWCALEDQPGETVAAIERPGSQLARCWKKLALGILVSGCDGHAQLARDLEVEPKPLRAYWAMTQPLIDLVGVEPLLDLPPPRA